MENVYESFIKNFKYNEVVVVAVSGGIDSMSLLDLLIRARKILKIKIICAHVNHNVRKESKKELEFVKKYCILNDVVFEQLIIENYGDDNFHNEARNTRYVFFENIVRKYNSKFLLTAHHADDLIETILMRLVRGSSLKGYAGFKSTVAMKGYNIIRPLIYVTKDEIIKYTRQKKIEYVNDESNQSDKYTRNRYRKNILPFLKQEDNNVASKFNKFSELLFESNNYIDNQIKKIISKIFVSEILDIEKYKKEDVFIQKKIIYYILEQKYQDDLMLINDKHVSLILNLINSKKSSGSVHLPNNIIACKSYNEMYFKIHEEDILYEIEIEDYVTLPNGKIIEKLKSSKFDGNEVCRLNSSEVKLPLYVRNRQDGDKMTVKGMLGKKKISDIFIDSKISKDIRNTYPVVCDREGNIVWLPNLKKSKFCKEINEKCDIIFKYY